MKPISLTAIIIDRHPFRSSSIIAEAVTDEGLLSMLCRGAKKDGAGAELSRIAVLSIIAVPGRGELHTFKSASITRDHPSIHASALKLAGASYLFSLVRAVKNGADERMLPLLDAALLALEHAPDERPSADAVLASSMVKLLYISGVLPRLSGCVACDAPYAEGGFFSFVRGGYVCACCADAAEKRAPFPPRMKGLLEGLIRSPIAEASAADIGVSTDLFSFIRRTFAVYAGKTSKSAAAYDEIAAVYAVGH